MPWEGDGKTQKFFCKAIGTRSLRAQSKADVLITHEQPDPRQPPISTPGEKKNKTCLYLQEPMKL